MNFLGSFQNFEELIRGIANLKEMNWSIFFGTFLLLRLYVTSNLIHLFSKYATIYQNYFAQMSVLCHIYR